VLAYTQPIFADMFKVIARARAAVKRSIDALAHAAISAEKSVADMGQVKTGGG
jgi:hypothetical protein